MNTRLSMVRTWELGVAAPAGLIVGILGVSLASVIHKLPLLHAMVFLAAVCAVPLLIVLAIWRPAAAVGLVLFLIPLVNRLKDRLFLELGWLRLTVDIALILGLFLLLRPRLAPSAALPPAILQGFLIAVGAVLATGYASGDAADIVLEGLVVPTLWFLVVLATSRTSRDDADLILLGLAAATFVAAGYAVAQFVVRPERPGSVYYSANILAEVMATMLPLMFVLTSAARRRWRQLAWLGFISAGVGLLLSQSRGAMLSGAVCLLLAASLHRPLHRIILLSIGALTLLATNEYMRIMVIARRLYLEAGLRGSSIWERLAGLRGSIRMISDRPVGFGPGGFAQYYPQYRPTDALSNLDSAHNLFLNTAVEYGVVGGAILVAIYVIVLRKAWHRWESQRLTGDARLLSLGTGAGVLAHALVSGLTGSTFSHRHIFAGQLFLWTLIALTYVSWASPCAEEEGGLEVNSQRERLDR